MSLGIGLNNGGYDQGLLEMWSSAVSLQLGARQTCHRKLVDRRKHVGSVLGTEPSGHGEGPETGITLRASDPPS